MTIYSLDVLNYLVKMLFRINIILCNESLVLEGWKRLRIVKLPPARQLVFWRNGVHLCCWQFRYSLATIAKTASVSGNRHFLLGSCMASIPLTMATSFKWPLWRHQGGQWLKLADVKWSSHLGAFSMVNNFCFWVLGVHLLHRPILALTD